MKTLDYTVALAGILIKQLLKAEKQCLTCWEVMAHKSNTPSLKANILGLISRVQKKIKYLEQLRAELKLDTEAATTAGVNGIVSEGFELIEKQPNPMLRDALVVQTIILTSHYKLGSYQTLQLHIEASGLEYESYIAQSLVGLEESTIQRLTKLLHNHVNKQELYWPPVTLSSRAHSQN
ncbi:MAG: DUF892 family protein [Cyclobacteriaceae bacterium]